MESNITTVARVNDVDIVVIEGDEKRVAIKPICEALGINFPSQYTRLQNDPILSSTIVLNTTVGGDGKDREMVTIPFKFVFGWLFRIDSRNVNAESRENVLKYQLACYNALYNSLFIYAEFVEYRASLVDDELAKYKEARYEFSSSKEKMNEAWAKLNDARQLTYEKYLENKLQLEFDFGKEAGNGN